MIKFFNELQIISINQASLLFLFLGIYKNNSNILGAIRTVKCMLGFTLFRIRFPLALHGRALSSESKPRAMIGQSGYRTKGIRSNEYPHPVMKNFYKRLIGQ